MQHILITPPPMRQRSTSIPSAPTMTINTWRLPIPSINQFLTNTQSMLLFHLFIKLTRKLNVPRPTVRRRMSSPSRKSTCRSNRRQRRRSRRRFSRKTSLNKFNYLQFPSRNKGKKEKLEPASKKIRRPISSITSFLMFVQKCAVIRP